MALLEAAAIDPMVRLDESLYPTEPDIIEELVHSAPDDVNRIMIVGHNPGTESFIAAVTGASREHAHGGDRSHLGVERRGHWRDFALDGRGTLIDVWRPREIEE